MSDDVIIVEPVKTIVVVQEAVTNVVISNGPPATSNPATPTTLGTVYGLTSTTSDNVFLGYGAGLNETGTDKLHINNSSGLSLISGDFSTHDVKVENRLQIGSYTNGLTDNYLNIQNSVNPSLSYASTQIDNIADIGYTSFLAGGEVSSGTTIYKEIPIDYIEVLSAYVGGYSWNARVYLTQSTADFKTGFGVLGLYGNTVSTFDNTYPSSFFSGLDFVNICLDYPIGTYPLDGNIYFIPYQLEVWAQGQTPLSVTLRNGYVNDLQHWQIENGYINTIVAKMSNTGKLTATIDGGSA